MLQALQTSPSQIPVTEASFPPRKNTTALQDKKWQKLTIMVAFIRMVLSSILVELVKNIELLNNSG